MKVREVLGHIDCPSCGTVRGMRVTADKNGDPFGYCEAECGQQLRVGGDAHRVRAFRDRYPWAVAGAEVAQTAPAAQAAAPEQKTRPAVAAPSKAAKRSSMADALDFLGMRA